jgi:hypothetical protein
MKKIILSLALLAGAMPAMAQQPAANGSNPFGTAAPAAASRRSTQAAVPGYATLAEAQQACGAEPIVWGNTRSHAYHASGDKLFGKTKHGTYLCQAAAQQNGFHAAGEAHAGQSHPARSQAGQPRH